MISARFAGGAARLLVAATVLVLPLALGGAHPEVNGSVAMVLLAGAVLAVWRVAGRPQGLVAGVPLALATLALGLALMQLAPVPAVLSRWLSPGAYEIFTLTWPQGWRPRPLTLDVPGTQHEVLKLVALSAAALLGAMLYRRRLRELFALVAISGVLVIVLAGLHLALRWDRPYATFGNIAAPFVSSFINPNHLAGFLGMSAYFALGLGLELRDGRRWLALGAAGLCAAGVFLSLSRGGILAFLLAAGLTAFLAHRSAIDGLRLRRSLPIFGVVLGGLGIVTYLSYGPLVRELWTLRYADGGGGRFSLWAGLPPMFRDFWPVGAGRGAFATAFTRYQADDNAATYTHAENEVLQTLADFGLVGGSLILGLGVLVFALLWRRARGSELALAGTGALAFVGIHNLVDFNLTLTSIGVPLALATSALCAPRRDEKEWTPSLRLSLPWLSGALAAGFVVVAVFAPGAVAHRIQSDTAQLSETLTSTRNLEQRERAVNDFLERHPADFLARLIMAEVLLRERDGARDALRWINRAMLLAPRFKLAHHLAGRALMMLGKRQQALLEYRLALHGREGALPEVANEVTSFTKSSSDALELAELSLEARWALAAWYRGRREYDLAWQVLDVPQATTDARGLTESLAVAAAAGRTDDVLRLGSAFERMAPTEPAAYQVQAQAHLARRDPAAARAVLERGLAACGSPPVLLAGLVGVLADVGDLAGARELARRLIARAGGLRESAQAHWLLGSLLEREGRMGAAVQEYERARDRAPDELGYRLHLASLRERAGELSAARAELERARAVIGDRPELTAALQRLRARVESVGSIAPR